MSEYKLAITFQVSFKAVLLWGVIVQTQGIIVYGNMGCWGFNRGDTKLERFLPNNQHTQRKLLNFENWCSGGVSKIDFQSLCKFFFFIFFSLKNMNAQFLTARHYTNSQKSLISFGHVKKGKNLSNFVSLELKLHNRYCHIVNT